MTIEELSFRSGVTTRNIRAYQSRGLLAQPVSHPGSRASFYTAAHLARLRLVDRLQARLRRQPLVRDLYRRGRVALAHDFTDLILLWNSHRLGHVGSLLKGVSSR